MTRVARGVDPDLGDPAVVRAVLAALSEPADIRLSRAADATNPPARPMLRG
ncbi:hypothetical protein [Actinokineospora sp.]|uniref:hypothetical protein n=1 Tax=Actinokineospora sp. TaxID=1872133 RepID=UPI0040383F05